MLDLTADSATFFSDFAEAAVYLPAGGGSPRNIVAIVRRQPPSYVDGTGTFISPKMLISVPNSTVNGISSAELNANGNDRIQLAWQIGGPITTFGVYRPGGAGGAWGGDAANDPGVLSLELR